MKRILWSAILNLILLFFLISEGVGKIYIDINAPGLRRFPVAIPYFKILQGDENTSLKTREVLVQDLEFTDLFKILDPLTYIEDPRRGTMTKHEIDFQDWTLIGAEALIKGVINIEGDMVTFEGRLFDVVKGEQILGKKYRGNKRLLRKMMHRFANDILYVITGMEGIFETKIVYTSKFRRGSKELFICDYDGFNPIQLTRNGSLNISPNWSSKGDSITFTSYMRGNPDLYLFDLRNLKLKLLSSYRGLNLGGVWSPDGSKIAFTLSKDGNSEIYTMSPDGSNLKRLTYHNAIDVSPNWSPDGSKIAFCSGRAGGPQIYVMNSDGTNIHRITFEGEYNASPAWSPRGDKIAFAGRRGGKFDIFIINPDGTGMEPLTFGRGNNETPSWSPDGRLIAFSSTRNGGVHIFLMNANGTHQKQITLNPGEKTRPSWSPRLK